MAEYIFKTLVSKSIGIVDEDQQIIEGYVTDDKVDVDGHVIDRNGFTESLVDFMKWGNIRDQHGLPVGKVLDIPEWNKFVVQIVDDSVWKKVKAGLYKGFSVGIRVLDYQVDEISNYIEDAFEGVPAIIVSAIKESGYILRVTKMLLAEVSIVDRPANPRALITATKSYAMQDDTLLPVSDKIIIAQKQYEGDNKMSENNQVTEQEVNDVTEKNVTTEAVVEEVTNETDLNEDKIASLEQKINDLSTNYNNMSKQMGDITTQFTGLAENVDKALQALTDIAKTVTEKETEDVNVDELEAEIEVEVEAEKSISIEEMFEKLSERIEKGIADAVEKLSNVEETERGGAVNLGEDHAKSVTNTATKTKGTARDAANVLAGYFVKSTAASK